MKKVANIMIFQNGNIAVFDENGEQIPELQESWLNFEALKNLAKIIVKDNPEVEGNHHIPTSALRDYISVYREHPSLLNPEPQERSEKV